MSEKIQEKNYEWMTDWINDGGINEWTNNWMSDVTCISFHCTYM